jgi:hypothetical protein
MKASKSLQWKLLPKNQRPNPELALGDYANTKKSAKKRRRKKETYNKKISKKEKKKKKIIIMFSTNFIKIN